MRSARYRFGLHTNKSKIDDVQVSVLLNNAGIGLKGTSFGEVDNWKKVMDVNLWGCVAFYPTRLS